MTLPPLVKSTWQSSIKGAYRAGVEGEIAAAWDLFTISGGPVMITQIWGVVTVIIATLGAGITPQLHHNPDGVIANTAISAAQADIDTDAPGVIYVWTGDLAQAHVPTAALGMAAAGETLMTSQYLILVPGVLNFVNAGAAATGVIDWYVNYLPCLPSSFIVPAY